MIGYINFFTAFLLVFCILVVLRVGLLFTKVLVEKSGKFSLSIKEQITFGMSLSYIITYYLLP